MPTSEQKRQKKLAKQQSREKKAKRELSRKKQELCSMAGKMRNASRFPILHCKVAELSGGRPHMLTVILSRRIAGGEIAMASFLLDCGCLGIKDSHGRYCTPGQYQSLLDNLDERQMMLDSSPERARALIEQTLAYAAKLGFSPHVDFQKAFAIFGDIDSSQCAETFPMGDEQGMPIYINGPFDDAAKQRAILSQLAASVGEENFHYMIGGPDGGTQALMRDDVLYVEMDDMDDGYAEETAADDKLINSPHWRRLE